ncbi:MAG TPA: PTS sugar transporter subunit IIA [Candidatus Hydrogenedentes bacterium]|nr:PTS sugar transporter subunit IIA [Candidatus Hydrogenedentota bacterium]HOL78264.1 PTS sugar transporter subunit IIA [Candidatus Hydrogenedentota bacterium]HPO85375.1 PTS sugar transporter subunit IIA [Candidatus Hydrogenedentota bacterium]
MDSQHEILTLEEVADYLRVSERTVYDWAQKAEIPCGKIGTSWRFRRSDIERWVEERLGSKPQSKEPEPVRLTEVLTPDRVILLDTSTKQEALEALIHVLSAAPQVRNKEDLAREVFRRERLMSTGIGKGIAVPHVRLASVDDLVMAAAICPKGISDYESLDGEPVRIILMVAANRDQHAQYLKTLASLCAQLKDDSLRERLLACTSAEEIYSLLVSRSAYVSV